MLSIINFQLIPTRLMGYKPLPQLLTRKIKSSLPIWKQIRKKQVVHLYRDLLKLSTQFQFDMYRNYIQNFTKERFKFHKFQYDNTKLKFLIQEGIEVKERLEKCLKGDISELKFLDDLVWGRTGKLKQIVDCIKQHPKKDTHPHRSIIDLRSKLSKMRYPYLKIPLDLRVYEPEIKEKPKKLKQAPSTKGYLVKTSFVYTFIRYQNRPQPHWFSMMLKNRLLQRQKRMDLYNRLKMYLIFNQTETMFLRLCGDTEGVKEIEELNVLLSDTIQKLENENQELHQKYKEIANNFKFQVKKIE